MSQRLYALIDPRSPRAGHWDRVFGTDCLEVESPDRVESIEDDGSIVWVYKIRVASLNEYQLGRLCRVFAHYWGISQAEVLEVIRGEHGVPVDCEDVVITDDPVSARIRFAIRRVTS